MQVFGAVRTVLAVRSYQDKPVPPDVVRRTVEAGRLTASSMNGQPWHFVVVENRDTLRQLGALARTGPYVAQAPLAVVVAIEETRDVLAILPFGFPAEAIGQGKKKRKLLSEVAHRERFAQPFE